MPLESIDNIHGGDSLPLGVFGVGDRVSDNILEEASENESGLVIDERADSSQREALEKIMSGEDTNDMATLAWVINATTATRHETMFRPIRIEADITKRTGKVIVDGVLEINSEPIKNPVTGEPHRSRIDSPEGVEFSIAEMASGTTKTHGGKMEFTDANDTHCHIAELHWNNAGVIRN